MSHSWSLYDPILTDPFNPNPNLRAWDLVEADSYKDDLQKMAGLGTFVELSAY